MKFMEYLFFSATIVPPCTLAFILLPSTKVSPLSLYAKTTKKKGTKSAPPAGGFGTYVAKQPSTIDDTTAFPALEPHVAKTLLGFNEDSNTAQDLSTEMYERIAGIYGFRSFNYLTEEAPLISVEQLLSTKSSDLTPLPPPPIGNLADLLSTSAITTGNTENISAKILPLSNLPAFEKFRVLHVDPMVVAVDDFFTFEECDDYVQKASVVTTTSFNPMESRSMTVGKDALAKAQRTSTTWFHHYRNVPELMAKASRLFGLDDITRWEEPQTVRYRRNEKFTWHLDALAPSEELEKKGGQRVATVLVYLTELSEDEGGATMFRDLGQPNSGPLRVQPKKGSALIFFPAAGGVPNVPLDIRTLHCGEAVSDDAKHDKWIAQLWLRERAYAPSAPPNNSHNDAYDAISKFSQQR